MAHFAEVDDEGTVLRVVVISNSDILNSDGTESEQMGIEVCRSIFGSNTNWVQTSYSHSFRRKFASVGDKYLADQDIFFDPNPPFSSWVLNDNYDWVAPSPVPDDSGLYSWDESAGEWVPMPFTNIEQGQ